MTQDVNIIVHTIDYILQTIMKKDLINIFKHFEQLLFNENMFGKEGFSMETDNFLIKNGDIFQGCLKKFFDGDLSQLNPYNILMPVCVFMLEFVIKNLVSLRDSSEKLIKEQIQINLELCLSSINLFDLVEKNLEGVKK